MDNDEIRISDLLYTVFKHRKTILVLGLLGFFCGFVFSGVSFLRNSRTNYAVNCSVAITSQPSADGVVNNNSDYLSSNTFYQTLNMMDAATFVMKSERTLQAAIDRSGVVSVTTQDVSQNLQVSRYNETQVLLLTLTWNNAEAGVQLMNALVDAIKEILPETLMMGSVAMIDAPEAASTTGGGAGQYVRLWVIFCVLGLAAGAGLAVLEFFLRPTLLNVKDVEDVLKLETLGSIPKDNSYFQKNMGNVLVRFDPELFMDRYSLTGEDRRLIRNEVFRSVEWTMLDRGVIDEEIAEQHILPRLPERLHDAARGLIETWDDPIVPVEGMLELLQALKAKGYRLYLLSNAATRQPIYWARAEASKLMDGALISAEVKLLKPDPQIYRTFLHKFALRPEECVFIDDTPINVEGALYENMAGIVFNMDVAALAQSLHALGVEW